MQKKPHRLISPVGFQDILVLVALHSLVAVQLFGFADDPGLGWHLSTGKWILAHFDIPSTDPFLFSATVRPWVSSQWLSDVLLWGLYSFASWPLLYCFLIIVFAFTYLGILYRGISRITGQYLLTSLALIFAFKIGQIHFILRPVMFSLFFFSIVYVLISSLYKQFWECEDCSRSLRRLFYLLPPLFTLWANMHPAFPLGLILIFVLPLAIALDKITRLKVAPIKADPRIFQKLFVLLVCCVVATFVNPHGFKVYSDIQMQMGDFAVQFFSEWAPLNFRHSEGQLFEISFFIVIMGMFFQPLLRTKLGWFGILTVLGFAHLGLNSVRFAPYYGIVAMIPLVYALEGLGKSDLLAHFKRLAWYRERLSALEIRERSSMHGYAVLSALLLLLLIDCTANNKLLLYEGPFGPSSESFPYAALDVLKETSLNEGPIVVAAPLAWGGFITFYGQGDMRAIIDDRTTLLGEEFYSENIKSLKLGSDWMGYLNKIGANRLLLPRQDPLAISIKESGDALPLFEDKLSILFELPSVR